MRREGRWPYVTKNVRVASGARGIWFASVKEWEVMVSISCWMPATFCAKVQLWRASSFASSKGAAATRDSRGTATARDWKYMVAWVRKDGTVKRMVRDEEMERTATSATSYTLLPYS